MGKEELLPGAVSQKQVDHWKRQWGEDKVYQIIVRNDDTKPVKEYTGYFRKPDMKVIQAASAFVDTDPIKSGLIVVDNCFLGGDEAFKTDDEIHVSAALALNRLFKIRVAEIKNL